MTDIRNAVIISAARTPTGKFQGLLRGFSAPDLGAIAIREAVNVRGSGVIKLTRSSWAASFRPESARLPRGKQH